VCSCALDEFHLGHVIRGFRGTIVREIEYLKGLQIDIHQRCNAKGLRNEKGLNNVRNRVLQAVNGSSGSSMAFRTHLVDKFQTD
jgi:hypothetical protein